MNNNKYQLGVGLVEVLVALLILAISVLGFIALQYRAIEAMSEGENRIQAINIARDLAEKIRINKDALPAYTQTLAQTVTALPQPNCFEHFCSITEKANFDAAFIKLSAQRMGMTINMMTCPEIANDRQCIYIAWNDTAATLGNGSNDCTSDTGNYNSTSTCVVMEMY